MDIHIYHHFTPDGSGAPQTLLQILTNTESLMKNAADFELELGQLKDALVASNGAKDAALAAAQAAEKTAEDNLALAQAAEKKAEDAAAALQAQIDAGVIPDNIAQEVQDIITSLTTPATPATSTTTATTTSTTTTTDPAPAPATPPTDPTAGETPVP